MQLARPWLTLLLVGLLSLIFPDFPGYGGGGGGGKLSSLAGGVSFGAAASATAESRLRDAVLRSKKTVLRLTSDVRLTDHLPRVVCPDLTVIGNCQTKAGRPRRCRIDGRPRFSGFWLFNHNNLTLVNLEVGGFNNASFIFSANGGMTTVRDCLFTRNGGILSITAGGGATVERSSFVRNTGSAIAANYANQKVKATDVLFEKNRGTVIALMRSGVDCVRCVFRDNVARSGPSVASIVTAGITFSRCQFIGNRVTGADRKVGAVDIVRGSADFCNCNFEGNTVAVAGGRGTELAHVSGREARLVFCKRRPAAGLIIAPPDPQFPEADPTTVEDSCTACPKV